MSLAARDAPLRWFYTMTDVQRLTRDALFYTARKVSMDHEDRGAAAYHGVVEHLYASERRPTSDELFWAGVQSVYAEVQADRRTWGQRTAEGVEYRERGSGPMFARYWSQKVTSFPDDAICERVALPQVLASLTGLQYDVLVAVATHRTQADAALSLGLPVGTVKARLFEARETIRALWMQGETPTVHRSPDVCHSGHPWAQFGAVSTGGRRYCRRCHSQNKRRYRAHGKVLEAIA